MKIEVLNDIVKQTNLRKIKKSLKAVGFIECKKSKALRYASLYDIAVAPCRESPYFPDGNGNEYKGTIYHNVKGYEQYEFVIVQLLAPFKRGCKDLSTKKMLIYAKGAMK